MWATEDLNEEECQPVVTKTRLQCQFDKVNYSTLDSKQIQRQSQDQTCRLIVSKHEWSETKVRRAVCRSVTLANERKEEEEWR
ncbi:hypothetical protein TNCV_1494491 [Trichonephila clavipes]|nr:hypothetical protein TNCV_1494491 [Trichonephila clavipes]